MPSTWLTSRRLVANRLRHLTNAINLLFAEPVGVDARDPIDICEEISHFDGALLLRSAAGSNGLYDESELSVL